MDFHFEPFLHLAGLTHEEALMAWGGFFFRRTEGEARDYGIVDDPAMEDALGERRDSIGVRSQPFGEAEVTVSDAETGDVVASATTAERNFVRIGGLQPDTAYTYQVLVDGEPFGQDPAVPGRTRGTART